VGRPPKAHGVIQIEGKSHRTKAELEQRRKGETALATGASIKMTPEVARSPAAAKEFRRLKKLYKTIGQDEALIEGIVNRHCQLHAECAELEARMAELGEALAALRERRGEMEPKEHIELLGQLNARMDSADRLLMGKRKMLNDIARESLMTPAAILRGVPRKPPRDAAESPMEQFLNRRRGAGGDG
jgi:septal ring factor EnvC (AmiA/AmiB activator)